MITKLIIQSKSPKGYDIEIAEFNIVFYDIESAIPFNLFLRFVFPTNFERYINYNEIGCF